MAKQIVSCIPAQSTDAEFRTWGSAISAALQSLLVKVTQTGEVNWSTVTKPSAGNTSQGFEVYRFADSLQSTAPVFIKIEYGSSGTAIRPGLWLTVGKGQDGAGNLTGVLLARTQAIAPWTNPSLTMKNCYIGTGDGSCLVMSMWPSDTAFQTTASGSVAVIERSRDQDGNATGVAVMCQYSGNIGGQVTYMASDYVAATSVSMTFGCIPIPYPTASGISLSNGVNTPVFTGSCLTTGRQSWVPTSMIGASQADFGIGVVATAIYNGVDYLALGAAAQYVDAAKQQYSSALIRWD